MKLNGHIYWCLSSLLLGVLALSIVSCGKNGNSSSGHDGKDPVTEPVVDDSEIQAMLAKQTVECERGLSCPDGVAKVVVVDRNKLRYCTGFLVTPEILATSSSCLTENIRISEERCEKEIHVFFPRSSFQAAKRVKCSRVLLASPLAGKDPSLWRHDVAYLQLEEAQFRRSYRLSREGMQDNKKFTAWKVDVEDETTGIGILRKAECMTVHKSYLSPLGDTSFSPNLTISGCEFKVGNRGAPLIGDRDRWRGLFSQYADTALVNFINQSGLLIEALKPLAHVSNAACLPSPIEGDVATERDCNKDLNYGQVDRRRAEMVDPELLHGAVKATIEKKLNEQRPYFNWQVDLVPNGLQHTARIRPRCLVKVNEWLRSFNRRKTYAYAMDLPNWQILLGIDGNSRVISRVDESVRQRVFVQFSPKDIDSNRATYVTNWTDVFREHQPRVTEDCTVVLPN